MMLSTLSISQATNLNTISEELIEIPVAERGINDINQTP
jgi:hypothetical protein